MKNKSKISIVLCISLGLGLIPFTNRLNATNFEGDEEYWRGVCSSYITNSGLKAQCLEFQTYLKNKKTSSISSATEIQAKIDGMQGDLTALSDLSKTYQTQIDDLNIQISGLQIAIDNMTVAIGEIEVEIGVKETNIEARIELIKERMVSAQVDINTNKYIDFIMGATDLIDMIQRSKWVQTYTDHDNKLIDNLNIEMDALEEDKLEQTRIKDTQALQQVDLSAKQEEVVAIKDGNDKILVSYQMQEAELMGLKNEANAAARTADANMPSLNFGNPGGGGEVVIPPIANTSGWLRPVNASTSAHTWAYPGGGLHIGQDLAASIGTPIYAPANGIVLYANNPVGSNSGGWGNTDGTPMGGGNTMFLLVEVEGVSYTVAIYHCSQNMPLIGKSTVQQGEIIGYVGHSGNSTGPHAHIEIIQLHVSTATAVAYWNSSKDWTFGTGWYEAGGNSSYGTRLRPETKIGDW